tara:strand:- start:1004 stop:2461 length:1458 start_codon:yes stop_codon:yes gene_type:complete
MGYIDNLSQDEYYQGSNFGNYQFVSLDDIITQFQIMYIGEDKLIPKAKRADISFHAQRALAELSFDTFKSFKSQQIDVPPSLVMVLPHDYVNYTKLSSVDSAGIKHPLYQTRHTSNPFQVSQNDEGEYQFSPDMEILQNGSFSAGLQYFQHTSDVTTTSNNVNFTSKVLVESGELKFEHRAHDNSSGLYGKALAVWQEVNVSNTSTITLSATGRSNEQSGSDPADGVLRLGLSTSAGDYDPNPYISQGDISTNVGTDVFLENGFLEWNNEASTTKTLEVDVSEYDTLYVLITSYAPHSSLNVFTETSIDNLSATNNQTANQLSANPGNELNSSTWNSYKSITPAENNNNHYAEHSHGDHDHFGGNERYGLDPSHAQINGSFYIDQRLGRIHFSSNISGKTVILDYISDGLGTDAEMQVPKLAEEAMYKHILYDVISARANIGGSRLAFHKKEKFAAVRKAKLRLSNIKLEELTQILRGQSKHIKH